MVVFGGKERGSSEGFVGGMKNACFINFCKMLVYSSVYILQMKGGEHLFIEFLGKREKQRKSKKKPNLT